MEAASLHPQPKVTPVNPVLGTVEVSKYHRSLNSIQQKPREDGLPGNALLASEMVP
jgi:hypothetical protein